MGNWPPQVERILGNRAGYLVVPILYGAEKHYPLGAETFSDTTPNAKGIVVQKIMQIMLTAAGLNQLGTPDLKCIRHEKAADVIELMNSLHQVYTIDRGAINHEEAVNGGGKAFKQVALMHRSTLKPSIRQLIHYGPTFSPDHTYRIVASMINSEVTEWVNMSALYLMGMACARGYLAALQDKIETRYSGDREARETAMEEIAKAETVFNERPLHWKQDDTFTGLDEIHGRDERELTRCEKRIVARMVDDEPAGGGGPLMAEGLDEPARRPPTGRSGKPLAYIDDWQMEGVIKPKVEFFIIPLRSEGVIVGENTDGDECEDDEVEERLANRRGTVVAALFVMVIGDPLFDVDYGVQKIISSVEERTAHQIRMTANGESGAKGAASATSWTEPFPDAIASDPEPLCLPGMPQASPDNERPPHLSKRHPVRHLTQKAWRNLLGHYLHGPEDIRMAVAANDADMPLTAPGNPMAPSHFFTMERAVRLIRRHLADLGVDGLTVESLRPKLFPTMLHPHSERCPTQTDCKPVLIIPVEAYKIPMELGSLWKHPQEYRLGDMPFPWITITVCIPHGQGLKEVDLSTARAERSQDYAGEYSVDNIINEYGLDPDNPTDVALARAMRQTKIEPEITPKKPQWVHAYLEKNGNAVTLFREQNAPAFQTLSGMLTKHNFCVSKAPTLDSRAPTLTQAIQDARTLKGPYVSSLPKDAYPELTPDQKEYGATYRRYLSTGLMRFNRILRPGGGLPRELEPVVQWWSNERAKNVNGEVMFEDDVAWYDPSIEDSYSQILIWDEATCNRVFGLTGGPIKVHMIRTAMLSSFGMAHGQVRFHVWIEGLPGTEKSFVVKQLRKVLLPEGVVNDLLTRTAHAMDTGDHSWGILFYDEAPSVLVHPSAKNGDELESFKAELSDNKRTRGRCGIVRDKSGISHFVKTVTTTFTEAVQIMCSNWTMPVDSPVAHRMAILPVTKVHHLAEKIMKQIMASNDTELSGIINRTTNSMYLLSTCCAYTFFMIDANLLFPMEDLVYKQLGGRLFDYISKKGINTAENVRVMTKYDSSVKVETIRHMVVTAFMMEGGIYYGKTPTIKRLAKAWSVLGYCNDSIVINNFAIIARQFIDNTASEVIRLIRNYAMPLLDGSDGHVGAGLRVKSRTKKRHRPRTSASASASVSDTGAGTGTETNERIHVDKAEEEALRKATKSADDTANFMYGNPEHIREFAVSMMNRYDDPLALALILGAIKQRVNYTDVTVENYESIVLSAPPPPDGDRAAAEAMMSDDADQTGGGGGGTPFDGPQTTRAPPPPKKTVPVNPGRWPLGWGSKGASGAGAGAGGKKDGEGKTPARWLSYLNLGVDMPTLTRIIAHLLIDTGEVPIGKVEAILTKWGRTVVEVRTAKVSSDDLINLQARWLERFPVPGSKMARGDTSITYPPSDDDINKFMRDNVCPNATFTKVLLENITYEPGTKNVCVALPSLRSTECDYLNKALQVVYYKGAHIPKKMVWAVDHYSNMPVFSTTSADEETQARLAARNGPWVINSTRDVGPDTASIIPGVYNVTMSELKTEAAEEVNDVIRKWYADHHRVPPEGLVMPEHRRESVHWVMEHHPFVRCPRAKMEEIMLRVSEKRQAIRKAYETRCADKFSTLHGNYMQWLNGRPVDLSEMAAYLCWMRHGAPQKVTPNGGPLTPTDIVTMSKQWRAKREARGGPSAKTKEVNYPGDVIKEYVRSYIRDGIDLSSTAGVIMKATLDAEDDGLPLPDMTQQQQQPTGEEPIDVEKEPVDADVVIDAEVEVEIVETEEEGDAITEIVESDEAEPEPADTGKGKGEKYPPQKTRRMTGARITAVRKRVTRPAEKEGEAPKEPPPPQRTPGLSRGGSHVINSDSNLGSLLESVRSDGKRRRTSMSGGGGGGGNSGSQSGHSQDGVPPPQDIVQPQPQPQPQPSAATPVRYFGSVAISTESERIVGIARSLVSRLPPASYPLTTGLTLDVTTAPSSGLRRIPMSGRGSSPPSTTDEMPDVVTDE